MNDINKYFNLVNQKIIYRLGQRCIESERSGYYCTLIVNDQIVPAKVFIGRECTEIISTDGRIHYYFENIQLEPKEL